MRVFESAALHSPQKVPAGVITCCPAGSLEGPWMSCSAEKNTRHASSNSVSHNLEMRSSLVFSLPFFAAHLVLFTLHGEVFFNEDTICRWKEQKGRLKHTPTHRQVAVAHWWQQRKWELPDCAFIKKEANYRTHWEPWVHPGSCCSCCCLQVNTLYMQPLMYTASMPWFLLLLSLLVLLLSYLFFYIIITIIICIIINIIIIAIIPILIIVISISSSNPEHRTNMKYCTLYVNHECSRRGAVLCTL